MKRKGWKTGAQAVMSGERERSSSKTLGMETFVLVTPSNFRNRIEDWRRILRLAMLAQDAHPGDGSGVHAEGREGERRSDGDFDRHFGAERKQTR